MKVKNLLLTLLTLGAVSVASAQTTVAHPPAVQSPPPRIVPVIPVPENPASGQPVSPLQPIHLAQPLITTAPPMPYHAPMPYTNRPIPYTNRPIPYTNRPTPYTNHPANYTNRPFVLGH